MHYIGSVIGSKFGGYGSFLPAYQRSPSVFCQPKSPPKATNHSGSRSPYNTQSEVHSFDVSTDCHITFSIFHLLGNPNVGA